MSNNSKSVIAIITILLTYPVFTQCSGKENKPLRIMSYNIRNCKGMDNVVDFDRVADVINRAAPDVVALQELDSVTQRYADVYILKELADRTAMHFTFAPAIDFQGGKYGIGILSKEVPLSVKQIPLPGEEERTFLITEFSNYYLCCTHLALEEEARGVSVLTILEAVKDIKKPLILAGDMNAEYGSAEQIALSKKFTILNDHTQNTFPADNPDRCIDFIYGYNNGYSYIVIGGEVLEETIASDHRPLFVDVRIK